MITVGHIARCTARGPNMVFVRVDRQTALGNPFPMEDHSDKERDRVIQLYREWLWNRIKAADRDVVKALWEILQYHKAGKDIVLLCWCAPRRCHADIIKNAVEWIESQHE